MTRALVTGGGGFLGLAIVRGLRARGVELRSFSRSRSPALDALDVEQIGGDLRDAAAVHAACRGADVVFHCAAKPPPWGRRAEYEAINVGGTAAVLAACRDAGVPDLVYTSTPSVVASGAPIEGGDESLPYGTFLGSEYARSKAMAEQAVLAAHGELRTVALRPHLIWGPGDPHFLPRFAERRRRGQLARIGPDDPLVDCTYVDHAASAHLLAWDALRAGRAGGKAYFITDGAPIGLWTMMDRLLATQGLPPVERRVPAPVAAVAAFLLETAWRTFGLAGEPRLTRFLVDQVTQPHWFRIDAARADLGYAPTVSLSEGLSRIEAMARSEQPR